MTTIQTRVRALTDYGTDIISSTDLDTLEEVAKEEIEIDTGRDDIVFTENPAKSATTWLTCLFCKVHTGEIGAEGFSVGELSTQQLEGQNKIWFNQYRSRVSSLQEDGGLFGSIRTTRSGREYGGEGDTAFGDN